MALRTNVRPWVLIGDTVADRPSAYAPGVGQGFLFHDSSTGDCSVMSVEPSTQVHTWEPFCCGESGCSGGGGLALLKWHGVVASGTDVTSSTLLYVSDGLTSTNDFVNPTGGGVVAKYPLVSPRTATNFAVNLVANGIVNELLVFFLIIDGVEVATINATAVGFGPSYVSAGPFAIPANATIDVAFRAASATQSGGVVFSATLELS